jgi:hypothetical protein
MTPEYWITAAATVLAVAVIAWLGIRRSARFQRWVSRWLRREAAGLDPAIDDGFARTLADDARDNGAV